MDKDYFDALEQLNKEKKKYCRAKNINSDLQ